MSEFSNYLWELLSKPFKKKKDTDVQKWVQVCGEILDEVKQCIFNVRKQWSVFTATGEALDAIGYGRRISRYPGEDDEQYRRRILLAFNLYSQGGTLPGMLSALSLIGYPNASIIEAYNDLAVRYDGTYRYNGNAKHDGGIILWWTWHNGVHKYDGSIRHQKCLSVNWAIFRVIIQTDKLLSNSEVTVLLDTVFRMKPAHTMPHKIIQKFSTGEEKTLWQI